MCERKEQRPKICDSSSCIGCGACAAACPAVAIEMKPDNEGFIRPQINEKCLYCGKCEQVCPVNNERRQNKPNVCYAVQSKDDRLLSMSSSGGVFGELAKKIISEGGSVFGVIWDNKNMTAVYAKAETLDGISAMHGSKYVQASTGRDVYLECKRILDEGRNVLFVGTPCQILALKCFLAKEYKNLLTVGLICHGVPSPKVLKRFKDEKEAQFGARLENISFRDKGVSWEDFRIVLRFSDGQERILNRHEDGYWRMFVTDVSLRKSCYECIARDGKSSADLIIGDFWGVRQYCSEMDSHKGVSAVLAYTNKGEQALAKSDLFMIKVKYSEILAKNAPVETSPSVSRKRDLFFSKFSSKSLEGWRLYFEHGPSWKRMLRALVHPGRILNKFYKR